jgi:streptogramin lyase
MNGNVNGTGTPRDLDPLLQSWMASAAPERAPERLLEEAFARTMGTRQLPVYPWHGLRALRRRGSTDRGRRDLTFAAVAVAIAVVLGAGLVLRFGREEVGRPSASAEASASPSASPSPSASASFPPAIPVTPQATISITGPVSMASDGTTVWLFTSTGTLDRIDPTKNTVAASVQLPRASDQLQTVAGNASGLWVTDWDANLLLRLDPQTLRMIAEIDVGPQPKGILLAGSSVWIANTHGGTVDRVDVTKNRVAATVTVGPTGNSGPNWLTQAFNSIWVDVPNITTVARIDPITTAVQATIVVTGSANPCGGLAVTSDAVWVGGCGSSSLARIDPATNRFVANVEVGGANHVFAVIGDRPWVSPEGGQIVRIDPATNTVDRVVTPGGGFQGGGDIAIAGGSLWIVDAANNRIIRLPLAAFDG